LNKKYWVALPIALHVSLGEAAAQPTKYVNHVEGGFYVHDPSAIMFLIDPTIFTIRKGPVRVVTEGIAIGETIMPAYAYQLELPPWRGRPDHGDRCGREAVSANVRIRHDAQVDREQEDKTVRISGSLKRVTLGPSAPPRSISDTIVGMKRVAIAALCLLASLIRTTDAVAQSNDKYQKGSVHWRIIGGGALPVDFRSARPDRRLTFGAVEIGRILTTKHGPGLLAGQFELSLQMMPIVVRGPEDFWGVGLTPVFIRWSFSGTRVVRPFVDASVGLMFVDWSTPGPGRIPINFNEQMGIGMRVGHARAAGFLLGYRFQHISNGSRTHPSPGVDTHLLYAGLSFVK
jgi:hypothetical protein